MVQLAAEERGTMAKYLLVDVHGTTHKLKLESCQYHSCLKITEDDGEELHTPNMGGLYIHVTALDAGLTVEPEQATGGVGSFFQGASSFFQTPEVQHRLDDAGNIFDDFYTRWLQNSLVLTRGIGGTHPGWNDLVRGTLRSEGENDLPTFTMGNSLPTRWLPTSFFDSGNHAPAAMPAIQGFTDAVSRNVLEECGMWLPAGLIVTIPAGIQQNAALCWLNSGEIVVRGPLSRASGEYELLRLVYVYAESNGRSDFRTVELPAPENLLAKLTQRPYQPSSESEMHKWVGEVVEFYAAVHERTGAKLSDPIDAPP